MPHRARREFYITRETNACFLLLVLTKQMTEPTVVTILVVNFPAVSGRKLFHKMDDCDRPGRSDETIVELDAMRTRRKNPADGVRIDGEWNPALLLRWLRHSCGEMIVAKMVVD